MGYDRATHSPVSVKLFFSATFFHISMYTCRTCDQDELKDTFVSCRWPLNKGVCVEQNKGEFEKKPP